MEKNKKGKIKAPVGNKEINIEKEQKKEGSLYADNWFVSICEL